MDLMTLAAKIVLDDSSYKSGVSSAEKAGSGLANKMSAMTVAVGNLAADMIKTGFGAIKNVMGEAISSYGNYEQLIGGVETLFKTSSDKVAAYAKRSYKTTGLSANDYMETVTSFSASLLQGLKGDTEAAADMADMAITDMADNANKMGTDISSIQAAYQGFAKQNYTMLDNLKLGYGGTASEMVRLINDSGTLNKKIKNLDNITFDQIVTAIHAVQDEMGITGTTSKEAAETLEGSKNAMKAAWEDLLSAIGGEGDQTRLDEAMASFEESLTGYMENFIPTLSKTIANSGSLVTAIAKSISSLPTNILTELAEGGLEAGTEMLGAVTKITNWVIDSITSTFAAASVDASQVTAFGTAIGEFIGSTISNLLTSAPTILEGMVNVGVALAGGLIEGLTQGLFNEESEVSKITEALDSALKEVDTDSTEAQALINYLDGIVQKYGSAAAQTDEWKAAVGRLDEVLPNAGKVVSGYGSNVEGAVNQLRAMNEEMRQTSIMSALTSASKAQWQLYGEQTAALYQAQTRYNVASGTSETYLQNIRDSITATAADAATEYKAFSEALGTFNQDTYEGLNNLANGLTQFGNIEDLDFEQLESVKDWLSEMGTFNDNLFDELNDDFDTNKKLYAEAQATMETAKAEMDTLKAEIEATKSSIAETEAAVRMAAEEFANGGESAGKVVGAGGDAAAAALESFAARVGSIRIGPRNGASYTPEATGIDSVPYNGFRAELHKGEMVMTAQAARSYRNGGGTSEIVGAVEGLRNDIQNIQLVVGQKALGAAVVDYGGSRMRGYIGQAERRMLKGYGR